MALKTIRMAAASLPLLFAVHASGADNGRGASPEVDIMRERMRAEAPDFQKIENPDYFPHWQPYMAANWMRDKVEVDEIESRCEAYIAGKDQSKSGDWLINKYHRVFNSHFRNLSYGEAGLMQGEFAKVEAWMKAAPSSKCAPLILANLWLSYAWQARGRGYASEVTPEGWRLFTERVQQANDVLDQHRHLNKFNPEWFELKVSAIQHLQGDRSEEMLGWVGLSVIQFPGYYNAAESGTVHYLPEWGGNWMLLETYIDTVAKLATESERDEVYTRLYWNMYLKKWIKIESDFRAGTLIDCGRFIRGFYDLMKRYPDSQFIKNSLAAFACRAEDKETYQRVRPLVRIDDTTVVHTWSAVRRHPKMCDQMFGGIPG